MKNGIWKSGACILTMTIIFSTIVSANSLTFNYGFGHDVSFSNLMLLQSDWTNSGGNAGRNGLSQITGPSAPDVAWSGGRLSLIAWLPVTEGDLMFVVRQKGWPGSYEDSLVVATDIATGEEVWVVEIPYHSDDWITWVGGVKNGVVYASRSGNGASVEDNLYALNAETGEILWVSTDLIDAGAYDGVVFAENGDPIIASFRDIWRFNAENGALVWHASRLGSVSGTCGGARFRDGFYVVDAAAGGHVVVRYDVDTGERLYESPVMAGFTVQTTPMVGPDGTIYVNRVQNNPAVDYLYAWEDTGSGFVLKWQVPSAYNTACELGIGSDGTVYAVLPGPMITRLDPTDGSVLDSYAITNFSKSRFAIDAQGTVFFSNGGFEHGRLYAFTSELTLLWELPVININIGGPSLAADGTLLVCGIGSNVFALHTEPMVDITIMGGFGKIKAVISNIGGSELNDLVWSMQIQGGLLGRINSSSEGIISELLPGGKETVQSTDFLFGLGAVEVQIEAAGFYRIWEGFIVGPFIFVKQNDI